MTSGQVRFGKIRFGHWRFLRLVVLWHKFFSITLPPRSMSFSLYNTHYTLKKNFKKYRSCVTMQPKRVKTLKTFEMCYKLSKSSQRANRNEIHQFNICYILHLLGYQYSISICTCNFIRYYYYIFLRKSATPYKIRTNIMIHSLKFLFSKSIDFLQNKKETPKTFSCLYVYFCFYYIYTYIYICVQFCYILYKI